MSEDENITNTYMDLMRCSLFHFVEVCPGSENTLEMEVDSPSMLGYLIDVADHFLINEEYAHARTMISCAEYFNNTRNIVPDTIFNHRMGSFKKKHLGRLVAKLHRDCYLGNLDIVSHDAPLILKFNKRFEVIEEGRLIDIFVEMKKKYGG